MELREQLERMRRNSIALTIGGQEDYRTGGTRFGGRPDLPPDFVWPKFEGYGISDVWRARPLAFLAQFDCGELAQYDREHLLPDHGVLSFFYEMDAEPWGYDPAHRGGGRVFWFEDPHALALGAFPEDLDAEFRLPMLRIQMEAEPSLPEWEDFAQNWPQEDWDRFEEERVLLGVEVPENRSKLLGWPDTIQGSMALECELVTQGYDMGHGLPEISQEALRQAQQTALERWQLLFQLDTVAEGGFTLMFGDCGRIYFYLPKEDLLQRRFDRAWVILQCC